MQFLDNNCQQCGGRLFFDADEKVVKCFNCGRECYPSGRQKLHPPAPPVAKYQRPDHIPRGQYRH